ncbi:hypothetical protein HDU84_008652 [Entophlyctis sp. JEL0112]|nr:hypothetical protein HDU84_008652 [Entophlyctis sp. JEL0112]
MVESSNGRNLHPARSSSRQRAVRNQHGDSSHSNHPNNQLQIYTPAQSPPRTTSLAHSPLLTLDEEPLTSPHLEDGFGPSNPYRKLSNSSTFSAASSNYFHAASAADGHERKMSHSSSHSSARHPGSPQLSRMHSSSRSRRPSAVRTAAAGGASGHQLPTLWKVLAHLPMLKAGFLSLPGTDATYFGVLFEASQSLAAPHEAAVANGADAISAPVFALYAGIRAQVLLGLSDEIVATAPAFGPLSLDRAIDTKAADGTNGGYGHDDRAQVVVHPRLAVGDALMATMPVHPLAAIRLSKNSEAHVAETGIFVLHVTGRNIETDADETWLLQLSSGDSMMEWMKCFRSEIQNLQ